MKKIPTYLSISFITLLLLCSPSIFAQDQVSNGELKSNNESFTKEKEAHERQMKIETFKQEYEEKVKVLDDYFSNVIKTVSSKEEKNRMKTLKKEKEETLQKELEDQINQVLTKDVKTQEKKTKKKGGLMPVWS